MSRVTDLLTAAATIGMAADHWTRRAPRVALSLKAYRARRKIRMRLQRESRRRNRG